MNSPIGRRIHEEETQLKAIRLAAEIGIAEAARVTKVPASTLSAWCQRMAVKTAPTRKRAPKYSAEARSYALELCDKSGMRIASEITGITRSSLRQWLEERDPNRAKRTHTRHSPEIKIRAMELAEEHGGKLAIVSDILKINEGTLYLWWKRHQDTGSCLPKKIARFYTTEEKSDVIKTTLNIGISKAARQYQISPASINSWLRIAGIDTRSKVGPAIKSADIELSWIETENPELMEWRSPCSAWLKSVVHGLANKIGTIQRFVRVYLAVIVRASPEVGSPLAFLNRTTVVPGYYQMCGNKTHSGVTDNNVISSFLSWVLLQECSTPDDYGRPVISPAFHNPVPLISSARAVQKIETVLSPLPFGYIEELRQLIAQGPTFSDWTWAMSAISETGSDWYEVSESVIDKSDPDCVWRRRVRSRQAGGPLYEMWSPVRWVALLVKLQLPLRTHQVRMLDSGEADYWEFSINASSACSWKINPDLLREGTERKPLQQGVFRRLNSGTFNNLVSPSVELYINTNKTADSTKSGPEKGYCMPWLVGGPFHANPFYWLCKLRDWQKKYNPIKNRSKWTALTPRHMAVKSAVMLASFPDACFLFRIPEAYDEQDRCLPVTDSLMTVAWHRALKVFEERLAYRGQTHADSSPIRLVRQRNKRATWFPLHSLRVSLLTALALDGKLPFSILQKIAGHSRLLMSLYYVKAGHLRIQMELKEGAARLDEKKDASIVAFLRETEYEKLVDEAISVDRSALGTVIPIHPASRNAAGWMPMAHGLCLVGGNTSPVADNAALGGCFNGGPNTGSTNARVHGPVPGGARNCIRCRWFVTEPHYLAALVAHMNVITYHFDEARNLCVKVDRTLDDLRVARISAEDAGLEFFRNPELQQAERLWESAMQRFNDRAEDVAACFKLIERCQAASQAPEALGGPRRLLVMGEHRDFLTAIEEVDSELLQIAGVCEATEIYPDNDPGSAILRQSQLLDAAFGMEGVPTIFYKLSEEEQLQLGCELLRNLARVQNPHNLPEGLRAVVGMIDAGRSLSQNLGVSLAEMVNTAHLQVVHRPLALRQESR
jgi:transposase-like protein